MQLRIKDTANLNLVESLQPQKQSNTGFLKSVVATLFRRKLLILSVFMLITLGAIVYAVITPNRYKTSMKIIVKNERVDPVVSSDDHTWADRNKISEEDINSEIELLKSKDLAHQIAERLKLDKRGTETGLIGRLLGHGAAGGKSMGMDGAIQMLQGNLEVNPIKKSDLIEITYQDSSPEMVTEVLQALGAEYLEKHLDLRQTPGAYDFFKDQATTFHQQLRDTQQELTGFRQKNDVTDLETQKKLILNYQADLEKVMLKTESDIQDAAKKVETLQRQLQALPERIMTQAREIPNQFAVERFNTLIVELQNKRTQLLTKFHPDDRLVQEIDQQIKDTQVALEKAEKFKAQERQTDPNPTRMVLEPELHRTQAALTGLKAQKDIQVRQLAGYRQRLGQLEGATLKNNELERTLKQTEESYKLYNKKEEEARIAKSLDQQKIANVTVAETPAMPTSPFKPNRLLTMILGAIIGFFVSLSLAFMLEYFSDAIHSADEIEFCTGLPVLATLPISDEYQDLELELIRPVGLIAPVGAETIRR